MSEIPDRPERLFRYFSPTKSHFFKDQKLWFSAASDFNDIFEAFPRHDKLVSELVHELVKQNYAFLPPEVTISFDEFRRRTKPLADRLTQDSIEQYAETFQEKFSAHYGIVCFSEHLDNLLMWGHYTGCHRGFVIQFDPQHSLFTPRDFGKVIYDENRPVLTVQGDSQMLLRKSPEWAYEDEHRLIKPHKELIPGTFTQHGVTTSGHYLPLPMDAIKAVYFGCRISPEDRTQLLKPLESFPKIARFFMRRNRIQYRLDAVPWNEWKEPDGSIKDILNKPWGATQT